MTSQCPILAFVGEVDDIGQPPAVRGIKRAAPRAEVWEAMIRASHFGLVVGSKAANITWPTVADWALWVSGHEAKPANISLMQDVSADAASGVAMSSRVMHGVAGLPNLPCRWPGRGRRRGGCQPLDARFGRRDRTYAARLVRLGQINDHTRISLGRVIEEQAHSAPDGEFLLFDGRVHLRGRQPPYRQRRARPHRGRFPTGHQGGLADGYRPSALVAIAALSRLGAVAVLMPPDADLEQAARLGGVTDVITDPANLPAASTLSVQILVLGGGENPRSEVAAGQHRDRHGADRSRRGRVARLVPAQPRLRTRRGVRGVQRHRWRGTGAQTDHQPPMGSVRIRDGFGRGAGPQRHRLLPDATAPPVRTAREPRRLGGGGSRIALSRGLDRDGSSRSPPSRGDGGHLHLVDAARGHRRPEFDLSGNNPIRLFMGSGMPTGLWRRILDDFAPARIVEFFATSDGQAVLANVAGVKVGSEGRPLPGGGEVELAAYDATDDLILEDDRGFVRVASRGRWGVCWPDRGSNRPDGLHPRVFARATSDLHGVRVLA